MVLVEGMTRLRASPRLGASAGKGVVTASVQWAVVLEVRGEFGIARRPRCHRPTAHEAARAWAEWREEDRTARVILRSTTGEEVVAEVTPVAEDGRLVYDVAILDEPVPQFGPA